MSSTAAARTQLLAQLPVPLLTPASSRPPPTARRLFLQAGLKSRPRAQAIERTRLARAGNQAG